MTDKRENFCQEYLIDLNATQAAIRAGYSEATARQKAYGLLQEKDVSDRIAELMEDRAKRTRVSQDEVINAYRRLAFYDPRGFYDEGGKLIPIHKLPDDLAFAIQAIDVNDLKVDGAEYSETKKIKTADKQRALDSIAKHLGMFIDRTELTGKDGGAVENKLIVEIVGLDEVDYDED